MDSTEKYANEPHMDADDVDVNRKQSDLSAHDDAPAVDADDVDVKRKQSNLSAHDDPFAPRDGKTLVWKDVNMTLVRGLS